LKFARSLAVILLLLLPFADVSAQTRGRRTTSPQRRRAPAAAGSAAARRNAIEVNTARARVVEQIKTLTRFLYVYGRLSKDLEASEAQARGSGAASEAAVFSNRTRTGLRSSLRNVREGLDQLEIYFRTTPQLQRYYGRVSGVAAGASAAEDQAAANRLDEAGRSLLRVVNQLADLLLEMA